MATESILKLRAVDQVSGVINRLQRKFPTLNAAIDKSRQRLALYEKKWGDVSRAMKRHGDRMKSVGRSLMTWVTLPATVAGGAIVNQFRKYEKALVGVGKTTDTEGAALDRLGDQFLNMSTKIPLSVTELLTLGEVAGQLGIAAEDVAEFSSVLGKLQFSTDVIGEEGARSIARILNLTGQGPKVINEFGGALVSLGNSAAASESEILGVATRVAGNVARFNITADAILGISTTLKELGKESELSGSAIGRGFNAIEQALMNGGEEFKALKVLMSGSPFGNLDNAGLRKAFGKDPTKVFQAFIEGLAKVDATGGNVIKVMNIFGLEGVRINDIYGTLLKNTDLLNKRLKQAQAEFRKSGDTLNALDTEAGRAFDTIDGKITTTLNTINKLAIKIGRSLRPLFLKFLEVIRSVFTYLEANPFLTKMILAATVLSATLGPLLLLLGSFLVVLPGLATAATAFGVGLGTVALVVGALPIAIAAVSAGLVLLYKHWDKVTKFMADSWDWVWKTLDNSAKLWLGPLYDWFGLLFDKIIQIKNAVSSSATAFFNQTPEERQQQGQATANSFTPYGSGILGFTRKTPQRANGSQGVSVQQNATLDINVSGPPGTSATVKKQTGFDRMQVNRGLQGAF